MHRALRLALVASGLSLGIAACVLWTGWQRHDSVLAHDTLPFYPASDLRPRWDLVSSALRVGRFRLSDQRARPVDQRLLDHGPTVVNLFFAGCVTVCPVSMDLLRLLHDRLGPEAPQFVSITVSPLTDDATALSAYARQFGLPHDWLLLTGAPDAVTAWARHSLYSDITQLGPDGLPPHTERAFLIDRHHRIRGIYDARSPHEVMRLRGDIGALRQEEGPAARPR